MMLKGLCLSVLACSLAGLPAWAADEPAKKDALAAAKPADGARADAKGLDITVVTTDVPEMKEYGEKIQKLAMEWYPKLAPMLPSDGFTPPQKVTIVFDKKYTGVAAAGGNRIVCNPKFYKDHPDDLGSIVHELTHVVQQYRRTAPGGTRPPGWLVEGIADYIRFYHYEPEKARPHPNAERAKYTDSYRTTAHFLNWAQEKYNKDLVVKINEACRKGQYKPELWKELTGKTVEELGAEWKESLAKK